MTRRSVLLPLLFLMGWKAQASHVACITNAVGGRRRGVEAGNWPGFPANCILALNFPLLGDALRGLR
jgi:hypothetical protein